MKNQKILTIIVILFLLIITIVYAFRKNNQATNQAIDQEMITIDSTSRGDMIIENDEMMKDDSVVQTEEKEMMTTVMSEKGTYQAYSPDLLALAENQTVVLFFRASWCPTCRSLDKDLRNNLNQIPQGLNILDIDYDNSKDLKMKYGVTSQHTLVQVDKDGNMIKKWTGGITLKKLISNLEE